MKILRSVLAIVSGMVATLVFVESIEYLLVVVVNGADVTSNEKYFAVRNQPGLLALKHIYNFLGGAIGGFIVCRIANYKKAVHVFVLMIIFLAGFVYAMMDTEMSGFAPTWAWVTFTIVSLLGVSAGMKIALKNYQLSNKLNKFI